MTTNSKFFSCDLVDLAQKHIWFLEQTHHVGATTSSTSNQSSFESLYRYQCLWLPLVAKQQQQNPTAKLIPPPDVAWFWHCHRLAPAQYSAYCQLTFGSQKTVLEANPPFAVARPNNDNDTIMKDEPDSYVEKTKSLWREHYPTESFFLSDDPPNRGEIPNTLLGFDLIGSVHRQSTFLWQVSGERFSDLDFLEEGVANYAKFLMLKPKASALHIILVPTYQIDLMWHTHMLSSIENYNKDCLELMKSTLSHDDSITDRSADGVLQTSFDATRHLWKNEYGVDYVVPGGMYRGEPPAAYYSTEWLHAPLERSERDGLRPQTTIALMGASSVSPPFEWADVKGLTSDGSQAFIQTVGQTKYTIRGEDRKDDYILGRYENVTGFYHIETREAHSIMVVRLKYALKRAESNIVFDTCCCGGSRAETEKKLLAITEVRDVWRERLAANGPMDLTRTQEVKSAHLREEDGRWAYPPALYMYSGGACGGKAATFDQFIEYLLDTTPTTLGATPTGTTPSGATPATHGAAPKTLGSPPASRSSNSQCHSSNSRCRSSNSWSHSNNSRCRSNNTRCRSYRCRSRNSWCRSNNTAAPTTLGAAPETLGADPTTLGAASTGAAPETLGADPTTLVAAPETLVPTPTTLGAALTGAASATLVPTPETLGPAQTTLGTAPPGIAPANLGAAPATLGPALSGAAPTTLGTASPGAALSVPLQQLSVPLQQLSVLLQQLLVPL